MDKTLRIVLIVGAVLVIAVGLLTAGFFFGRATWGWNTVFPAGMMGAFSQQDLPFGYGMMGGRGGSGMMGGQGYTQQDGQTVPYGPGMMGGGMMGGFGTTTADPLSAEESLELVEAYLADLGNDDLAVAEIMVFDYNSYAIVQEESTGIGAFELLIDPATKSVFPEYGPNMMWNLKYGMHAGSGFAGGMMSGRGGMMGGGMMGGYGYNSTSDLPEVSSDLSISAEKALDLAQDYLDTYQPGVTVSDEITAFYGYYTIDLEKDGAIVGMLSVNGFSGQVFPHTWHGTFIEMVEIGHE